MDREYTTANKGEWSEPFVWLWILGRGRIYAADVKLEPVPEKYYVVRKVILNNKDQVHTMFIDDDTITVKETGKTVLRSEFVVIADHLLNAILTSNKTTFAVPAAEDFLRNLGYYRIKMDSTDKNDLFLEIYDPVTCSTHTLGFSIKSDLGGKCTLLNVSRQTYFVFRFDNRVTPELIEYFNHRPVKGEPRVLYNEKFEKLMRCGHCIRYDSLKSDIYKSNLMMIDSRMDEIVAYMLYLHYVRGISSISDQIDYIVRKNPLGIEGNPRTHYEYKIKKFLAAHALGMMPGTLWDGHEDATGGIIIASEVPVCVYLYNRNDFEDFLMKSTKLESPARRNGANEIDPTGRTIELGLQVRFK